MGKNKKEKKVIEPQYYSSAINTPTYNYKVYHMKFIEKLMYFIIAFIVGAAVGYLFYGGIGTDEFGNPTTLTWTINIIVSSACGIVAGLAFIPMRTEQIVKNQQKKLNSQFRDMLEALNTSFGAGKNIIDSFRATYEDLKVQYDEGAYILQELSTILNCVDNNVLIEDALADFGSRSGIEDITSFANVFKISYRKGGNIKETIRSTHDILTDKMEIGEDIETIVTSNKTEQKIMIAMPIALIGMIKMMSTDFAANFTTLTGIISTTIAIGLFIVAYIVGKIVLDIKV